MTIAFVLGNGKSRLAVDPQTELLGRGTIYGCNAIYRDFMPQVLVSTDKPISDQIQIEGIPERVKHWTRRPLPDSKSLKIERPYYGMSSGPVAISRAALDGHSHIYFMGFDLGSPDGLLNNIYGGSEFYKANTDKATFAGNWVFQINQISREFRNAIFYRVVGVESTPIKFENKWKNVEEISMEQFKTKINKL
jgi:hypothetical protein